MLSCAWPCCVKKRRAESGRILDFFLHRVFLCIYFERTLTGRKSERWDMQHRVAAAAMLREFNWDFGQQPGHAFALKASKSPVVTLIAHITSLMLLVAAVAHHHQRTLKINGSWSLWSPLVWNCECPVTLLHYHLHCFRVEADAQEQSPVTVTIPTI